MKSVTKKLLAGTVIGAAIVAGSASALVAQEKPVIATVVKISGIPWFDRMNTGVEAYQKANPDVVATQSGPATADAAQQLQIVQDLVAKGVNALAVVPMDPAVLEGTFKRAMERGIIVVTHEADNRSTPWPTLKLLIMPIMARHSMSVSQNAWARVASGLPSLARSAAARTCSGSVRAKKTPRSILTCSSSIRTTNPSTTPTALMKKAKEILRKHPDLKGFQTSAGNDVLGVGRAIDEAGLSGKVCTVGTGLPNPSADLLESGAITAIGFWDPQKAGMAMNAVAKLLLEKKEVKEGTDLGVEGYNKVSVKKVPVKASSSSVTAWLLLTRRPTRNICSKGAATG